MYSEIDFAALEEQIELLLVRLQQVTEDYNIMKLENDELKNNNVVLQEKHTVVKQRVQQIIDRLVHVN